MPVKDGWFTESEVMWPGQRFALKVEEVLHEGRSDFQVCLARARYAPASSPAAAPAQSAR